MSDYFQVIAHYQVKTGEIETVAGLLRKLADASRQEPGNLAYDYFQDFSDPAHLVILERYISAEHFTEHRESPHFRSLGLEQIIPRLESRQVEMYSSPPA
ncbi:putative quinol monooxygenase [Arthrobacter sp. ov118]|uniref:putative quinol monooxygenase n=1 Tax=Arthrobacter sp. ov118 TaxID=1761747 RepID=UPI0008DFF1BA|nr:putative quinol monooxygenase [Arthrobacter sp. ov118]SFU11741.1 Antibiotic biosynthesis monooxygenase [Arthrobacter sp. ov118]